MSPKVVLIFAIGIFATLPAFNALYITSLQKRYTPVFSPNSFWHLQKYLIHKNERDKTMSGSMKVDMKETLVRDLKFEERIVFDKRQQPKETQPITISSSKT